MPSVVESRINPKNREAICNLYIDRPVRSCVDHTPIPVLFWLVEGRRSDAESIWSGFEKFFWTRMNNEASKKAIQYILIDLFI
jgi:hypothetical protein